MQEFAFKHIETQRFSLRILEADAYRAFLKTASDEQMWFYIGIASDEVAGEKAKCIDGFRTYNKSYLMFVITDKASGHIIGYCGYHTWYLEHNRAEVGYGLYSDAWKKQGVMSEVLHAVLSYGFATMKLKRVEAFIQPNNIASLRTAQKMGFIQEGRLRGHYQQGNEAKDSLVFGLLASEFHPIA